MPMSFKEQENLLSGLLAKRGSGPCLIEPEAFLLIKENGILDAAVIRQLQAEVERAVASGCLVLVNDDQVNAYAMEENGVPVIALFAGTISRLLRDASLLMLSAEFLPEVGDLSACLREIDPDQLLQPLEGDDASLVRIVVSNDPVREAVGYMLANLAVRFIVYHEIGHHQNGDVKLVQERYHLFYQERPNSSEDDAYHSERQRMELEADAYAIRLLVTNMKELMERWIDITEIALDAPAVVRLIVSALVLIQENLSADVFSPEEINRSDYLPGIVRISVNELLLILNPSVRQVLSDAVSEAFRQNTDLRKTFEQEYELCVFDSGGGLTPEAYVRFFSLMLVQTKQTYADIFIGHHGGAIFQPDIKVLRWFQYQ